MHRGDFLARYKYLVAFLISFIIIAPFMIKKKMDDFGANQSVQANLEISSEVVSAPGQSVVGSKQPTATETTEKSQPAEPPVSTVAMGASSPVGTGVAESAALTSEIEGTETTGSTGGAGATKAIEGTEDLSATESEVATQDGGTVGGESAAEVSRSESATSAHEDSAEFPEVPFANDRSFFDNALFIGDSRTMGLCEYGDVGNADVFAGTGMSVYDLLSKKSAVPCRDGRNKTLDEMLSEKKYSKIYFMLGINELGYDFGKTVEKYREMVRVIKGKQPGADLVLELNQHVTEVQSRQKPLFGNENINKMNDAIRTIGNEEGLRVLDVNVLFDDSTGALNPAVTFDNVHVLGKYYKEWTDWILRMETARTTN